MRKLSYPLLIILFLLVILFPECNCEFNKKGTPSSGYSETMDQAKENGVFKSEVVTDKSISIVGGGIEFEIKNAWIENTWNREHYIFGKAPLVKNDNSYQLLMNLGIKNSHSQTESNFYYFIHDIPLDTFMHYYYKSYYSHRMDTIKVPFLGKRSSNRLSNKDSDFLIFTKRRIQR